MRDQFHIVIRIEKTQKSAVHCCITFTVSYAGLYSLFYHCRSYFRI